MIISTTNFESTTVDQSNAMQEAESNATAPQHMNKDEVNSDLLNRVY